MAVVAVGTAAVLAAGLVTLGLHAGHPAARSGAPERVPRPVPSSSPSARPTPGSRIAVPADFSLVAHARGDRVRVYRAPGATAKPRWRLANPNGYGAPLVFLVVGRRPGWLRVDVPVRPNGATGWVRRLDVTTTRDPYLVKVDLATHRLVVVKGGLVVEHYPVGVGRPSAPTPTGRYYLTELLVSHQPAYGPFAYGVSAFSDTYASFEGGPGQIGLHGTSDPSSVGRSVSHGCIRMHDSDITALAHEIPAGTPIDVMS